MRLAIVIGHTARSPGAWSAYLEQSEYQFNTRLALSILALAGDEVGLFRRDGHGVPGAYAQAAAWGATGAVELHFNSHVGRSASGSETLYVTPRSRPLAEALQRRVVSLLGLPDRGAKPPWRDRGRASLTALPIPSVIVEPFFGSNPRDCARVLTRGPELAEAILEGARAALGGAR